MISGIAAGATALLRNAPSPSPAQDNFELAELTVADLQAGMQSGRWTARSIAEQYLARIDQVDKQTHAVLELQAAAASTPVTAAAIA